MSFTNALTLLQAWFAIHPALPPIVGTTILNSHEVLKTFNIHLHSLQNFTDERRNNLCDRFFGVYASLILLSIIYSCQYLYIIELVGQLTFYLDHDCCYTLSNSQLAITDYMQQKKAASYSYNGNNF